MKTVLKTLVVLTGILTFGSSMAQESPKAGFSLRVEAGHFRNSEGAALFALYNEEGSIPDEKLKQYYKKETGIIVNGKAFVTFEGLPAGRYAVTVLHDENSNGEIDKIFFYPKEGFGLTIFEKISLLHRPDFSKACFVLSADTIQRIKLIYN